MIRIVVSVLLATAVSVACASTQESESAPEPVVKTQPSPESAPTREVVAETRTSTPAQLPKTASPLPLVGLAGLAALGLGVVTRAVRRRF